MLSPPKVFAPKVSGAQPDAGQYHPEQDIIETHGLRLLPGLRRDTPYLSIGDIGGIDTLAAAGATHATPCRRDQLRGAAEVERPGEALIGFASR
jgi:hypothetical protein